MGWQSSLLGGNVVSSYEHIDNLRNDLTAGRFWDNGETKYTRVSHDGANGIVESSFGNLVLKRAGATLLSIASESVLCEGDFDVRNGNSVVAHNAENSAYAYMYHDGAKAVFASTYGRTQLAGNANHHVHIGSGAGQSRIYFYDATLGEWRYIYVDNGSVQVGA
jgi:hypothetical protein